MEPVGYAYLKKHLKLTAFGPAQPAMLAPVTKVTPRPDALLIPAHVAPAAALAEPGLLAHLLFALKHEGVDLQLLAQAMPAIPAAALHQAIWAMPTARYIRVAGYLWELFTQQELANLPAIAGPTAPLFDERIYLTGPARRNAK